MKIFRKKNSIPINQPLSQRCVKIHPIEIHENNSFIVGVGVGLWKASSYLIENTVACSNVPRPKREPMMERQGKDPILQRYPNGRMVGQPSHRYRAVI